MSRFIMPKNAEIIPVIIITGGKRYTIQTRRKDWGSLLLRNVGNFREKRVCGPAGADRGSGYGEGRHCKVEQVHAAGDKAL